MNSIICVPDEKKTEQYPCYPLHTDVVVADNSYATSPLPAVRPASPATEEEMLHSSFEEAISDRLAALHERHPRLSDPSIYVQGRRETEPLTTSKPLWKRWQRRIMYGSVALMCGMIGFDLMGLLVLLSR